MDIIAIQLRDNHIIFIAYGNDNDYSVIIEDVVVILIIIINNNNNNKQTNK